MIIKHVFSADDVGVVKNNIYQLHPSKIYKKIGYANRKYICSTVIDNVFNPATVTVQINYPKDILLERDTS